MNHQELDDYLRSYDSIERLQKRNGGGISDYGGVELAIEADGIPRLLERYFLDNGSVSFRKHHRFAEVEPHRHEFIELNYMYSGSCRQTIGGLSVTLNQGELCLLDRDATHGIDELGEDDVLVNLLIRGDRIGPFVGRALTLAAHRRHDGYILFRPEPKGLIHEWLRHMMCEFYGGDDYSPDLLRHYLPLVFAELMRIDRTVTHDPVETPAAISGSFEAVAEDILAYMEENYPTCTLGELGSRYHFNPNYLGQLLKAYTGNTFRELIQAHRLNRAAHLLRTTQRSVEDIAHEVGYASHGFFNRKFKANYGQSPSLYRQTNR